MVEHPMEPMPDTLPLQTVTLASMGGTGAPLLVKRFSAKEPPTPPSPAMGIFALLALPTAGVGRIRIRGDFEIGAGDLHFVPPGQAGRLIDPGTLEVWAVLFEPSLLLSLRPLHPLVAAAPDTEGSAQGLLLQGPLVMRLSPQRQQRMQRLLLDMEVEQDQPGWGSPGALQSLFHLLLTEVAREMVERSPQLAEPRSDLVGKALAFMQAHCLEPISLQDVAAAVGRTSAHLATAVRRETGLTVGDWLLELRMAEARRRLMETPSSVESIASQVGYVDVTHFIRRFRLVHGMTPRAWRERRKGGPRPAPEKKPIGPSTPALVALSGGR
jgi:AraC family transcriptional regulator, transcriptional activator of pobA